MLIISYDKKNTFNVSDKFYYKLHTEKFTYKCDHALVKEFFSRCYEEFPVHYDYNYDFGKYGGCDSIRQSVSESIKSIINLYSEVICSKLLLIVEEQKKYQKSNTNVDGKKIQNFLKKLMLDYCRCLILSLDQVRSMCPKILTSLKNTQAATKSIWVKTIIPNT